MQRRAGRAQEFGCSDADDAVRADRPRPCAHDQFFPGGRKQIEFRQRAIGRQRPFVQFRATDHLGRVRIAPIQHLQADQARQAILIQRDPVISIDQLLQSDHEGDQLCAWTSTQRWDCERDKRQPLHRMQTRDVDSKRFDAGACTCVVVRARQVELAAANIDFIVEQQRENQRRGLLRLPRGCAQASGHRRLDLAHADPIVSAGNASLMNDRARRQMHVGICRWQHGSRRLPHRCRRRFGREARDRNIRAIDFALDHASRLRPCVWPSPATPRWGTRDKGAGCARRAVDVSRTPRNN